MSGDEKTKNKRKFGRWIFLGLVIGMGVAWFSPAGKAVRALFGMYVLDKSETNLSWNVDSEARLKAMHTAAMLFHDSEEAFPKADSWMDELLKRLNTDDLKEGEFVKKITRPDVTATGQFGYAINVAVAGKYKGDISDPKTVLIFESRQTQKNASGKPKEDAIGMGVCIDGSIVKSASTSK
jgi:hypothetical protein